MIRRELGVGIGLILVTSALTSACIPFLPGILGFAALGALFVSNLRKAGPSAALRPREVRLR